MSEKVKKGPIVVSYDVKIFDMKDFTDIDSNHNFEQLKSDQIKVKFLCPDKLEDDECSMIIGFKDFKLSPTLKKAA